MLIVPRAIAALVVSIAVFAAACGSPARDVSPTGPSGVSTLARSTADAAATAAVSGSNFDEGGGFLEPPADEPEPGSAAEPQPGEPAPEQPDAVPGVEPAPVPEPVPGQPAPAPVEPFDPNRPRPGPPTTHPLLVAKVDPDPVPFSGTPIPLFSCRDLAQTWYYTQVLHVTSGISVTITERQNFFDGNYVSTTKDTFKVEGNGTVRLQSRWCSAFGHAHTAQHRYKGTDENGNEIVLMGPVIVLQANPHAPPAPPSAPASRPAALSRTVGGH